MKILKISYYSHSSFLLLQNFEIWVYIENMYLIIHIVPFLWLQNFEIWVYKGMKIHFLLVT